MSLRDLFVLGYQMGLKPSELRDTTLYDFNCMAEAFNKSQKHDYEVMRMNAYLISVYSGLEGKTRKKLTPEKILPLEERRTTISHEEKWKLHRLMRKMNRDVSRTSSTN